MSNSLSAVLETPWKIRNELARWWAYPWTRLLFAWNGIEWGRRWRFYGIPIVQKHRRSTMLFGDGLSLRSTVRSNPLGPAHPVILTTWAAGAVMEVGADFAMSGGTLCAAERISIGEGVSVGANSTIIDTDFHPLTPGERRLDPQKGRTAPIRIEADVFIGMNCVILKGVTVGRGSVVGAGAVVVQDVPPATIVAGNPAKVIRRL